VEVARRALSALNWGKHLLAREAGLFRDVLLHWRNVTEILGSSNGIYSYW
jgi:hypothetical protein